MVGNRSCRRWRLDFIHTVFFKTNKIDRKWSIHVAVIIDRHRRHNLICIIIQVWNCVQKLELRNPGKFWSNVLLRIPVCQLKYRQLRNRVARSCAYHLINIILVQDHKQDWLGHLLFNQLNVLDCDDPVVSQVLADQRLYHLLDC